MFEDPLVDSFLNMTMINIALTIRSFSCIDIFHSEGDKNLHFVYINSSERRMNSEEIILHCQEAEAVIAGTEKFSADVIRNLPNLKIISRVGVGTDSIDLNTAKERGITVCTTPNSTISAVAEHTIALILALSKNIPRYSCRELVSTNNPGHMVKGKVAGIIGLGRIGKEVARLISAMGADVQYYDPCVVNPPDESWKHSPSLFHILSTSDIISLHIPAFPNGQPLLGKKDFSMMKRGSIVINTARGSLIDENELAHALDKGIIMGAGLDVTNREPYQGPLLHYPQVLITPHVASNTFESRKEMEKEAIMNIINYFEKFHE